MDTTNNIEVSTTYQPEEKFDRIITIWWNQNLTMKYVTIDFNVTRYLR